MPGPDEWEQASEQYRDEIDDPDLAEMISCAWALLTANLALIDWLECVITGDEAGGGCLRNTILGLSKVTIQQNDWVDPDWNMGAFLGGPIWVNKPSFAGRIAVWQNGSAADRECVCATIAGLLLHEMWHTCGNTMTDWMFPNLPCSKAQNLEHSFTWAMSQWYPTLNQSGPCTSYDNDAWWYNTNNSDMWGNTTPNQP